MAASSLVPGSASIASSPPLRNASIHQGDDEGLLPRGAVRLLSSGLAEACCLWLEPQTKPHLSGGSAATDTATSLARPWHGDEVASRLGFLASYLKR